MATTSPTAKQIPARNCTCGGSCLFCDGTGIAKFQEGENTVYDEDHGWNEVEGHGVVVKEVMRKCHICEGGKCNYCNRELQKDSQVSIEPNVPINFLKK